MDYEHDLLLAFWLAIHKEDIAVASNLIDWDPSLRYMATLAFHGKRELCPQNQDEVRKREEEAEIQRLAKIEKDKLKGGVEEKASENTPSKVPPSSNNPGSDKPQMEGGQRRNRLQNNFLLQFEGGGSQGTQDDREDSDDGDDGEDDGEGDDSDTSGKKKSQINDDWG